MSHLRFVRDGWSMSGDQLQMMFREGVTKYEPASCVALTDVLAAPATTTTTAETSARRDIAAML